jgi:hypothetical protein
LRLQEFRSQISAVLEALCHELVGLIDTKLISAAQDVDAQLFYSWLKADYCRYLCENRDGPRQEGTTAVAAECYEKAIRIARDAVPLWRPSYLGLVLNSSVCLFEIVGKPGRAIRLAEGTLEESASEITTNSEDTYNEAVFIRQLIRDNVALETGTAAAAPEIWSKRIAFPFLIGSL